MQTLIIICNSDINRSLIFYKDEDSSTKEQIYVDERNMNVSVFSKEQYRCTGFTNNDFNKMLSQLIDKAIRHKSIKLQSARWYPYYDSQAMCGYGPVYITSRVECKGNDIKLTMIFGYIDLSSTYLYVINGYDNINSFLEFLKCK